MCLHYMIYCILYYLRDVSFIVSPEIQDSHKVRLTLSLLRDFQGIHYVYSFSRIVSLQHRRTRKPSQVKSEEKKTLPYAVLVDDDSGGHLSSATSRLCG